MRDLTLRAQPPFKTTRVFVNTNATRAASIAANEHATRVAIVHAPSTRAIAKRIHTAALKTHKNKSILIELPEGEKLKQLATVQKVWAAFDANGLDRESIVIAVGGGTLGDVAGFAAATYLRGIPIIHVPTTLLAMVDSSIGGKTGVNFNGKNRLGTFHAPLAIVCDLTTLKTLPVPAFRQGLAELAKTALIADASLVSMLERNASALSTKQASDKVLEEVIARCIQLKGRIVAGDPFENPRVPNARASRMLLNAGHSIGHAIETTTKHQVAHGNAVAMGLSVENRIAVNRGLLRPVDAARIHTLLENLRLPTRPPANLTNAILKAARTDKKNRAGQTRMALLTGIGKARVVTGIQEKEIRTALNEVQRA